MMNDQLLSTMKRKSSSNMDKMKRKSMTVIVEIYWRNLLRIY